MQTKQSQRDEFIKKFCPHNTDPVLRIYADYWLQKQDQLLTELGESLEKEKGTKNCYECGSEMFDKGLCKALSLINKYK